MTRTPFWHKNIRLARYKYVGPHSYFVTLCCERRRRVFANSERAAWLVEKLREKSDEHGFEVLAYCVMPDHFHVLAQGKDYASDLLAFVQGLKQTTAHEYLKTEHVTLWQKKYYDHILRGNGSADRVAAYIWLNPVRKGMCNTPAAYPYAGSFTDIGTKLLASTANADWTPPWKSKTDLNPPTNAQGKPGIKPNGTPANQNQMQPT